MELYDKAVEFIKMKKHICGESFFSLELKVTVLLSAEEEIFIGCSTKDDLSEYNAFINMKLSGKKQIKKMICVDEYECVFLPSMKFIDYIVNDNQANSDTLVFIDPTHIISVFSIIEISNNEIKEINENKNKDNRLNSKNSVPTSENIDFNSDFDDFSDEHQKPVRVIGDNNIIKAPPPPVIQNQDFTVGFSDDFENEFENTSPPPPVVVIKKDNFTEGFETGVLNETEKAIPVMKNEFSDNSGEELISNDTKESTSLLSVIQAKRMAKLAKKNAKKTISKKNQFIN